MGKYNVLDIAEYIINYAIKNGYAISNLKLQKILYFVQAQFLFSLNVPCFSAPIEAWEYGPVVKIIYHKYKRYGSSNIYTEFDNDFLYITETDKKLINLVVDNCAFLTAMQLVEITHQQKPWKDAYNNNGLITNKSIQEYFGR